MLICGFLLITTSLLINRRNALRDNFTLSRKGSSGSDAYPGAPTLAEKAKFSSPVHRTPGIQCGSRVGFAWVQHGK